jgi:uncharacterized membrane protein
MPVAVPRAVTASLSAALLIALAVYPLFVYVGIGRFGVAPVAGVLAVACLVRLLVLRWRGVPQVAAKELLIVCIGGIVLAGVSLLVGSPEAVRYYPVLVNAGLFTMFAASLVRPPSLVERLARVRHPELPPVAVAYTRHVTIAWTIFFAVNGGIALYTAIWTPLATWAWYNGFIAYLLIAALFGVEFLIRAAVIRKHLR